MGYYDDLFERLMDHLVSFDNWATDAAMDDEIPGGEPGERVVTLCDIVGDEHIESGFSDDIMGGIYCDILDMPRGSTGVQGYNCIREALTGVTQ